MEERATLGRHVVQVMGQPDGSWTVRREGDADSLRSLPSREAAVNHAERLARGSLPSKVVVEGPEGTIEEERVFGVDEGLLADPPIVKS